MKTMHKPESKTKLESLFDRISIIDERFEIILRDAQIKFLKKRMALLQANELTKYLVKAEKEYTALCVQVKRDRAFLRKVNASDQKLTKQNKRRVQQIADTYSFLTMDHEKTFLLYHHDVHCLQG